MAAKCVAMGAKHPGNTLFWAIWSLGRIFIIGKDNCQIECNVICFKEPSSVKYPMFG